MGWYGSLYLHIPLIANYLYDDRPLTMGYSPWLESKAHGRVHNHQQQHKDQTTRPTNHNKTGPTYHSTHTNTYPYHHHWQLARFVSMHGRVAMRGRPPQRWLLPWLSTQVGHSEPHRPPMAKGTVIKEGEVNHPRLSFR